VQAATVACLAGALFLAGAGVAPTLIGGEWAPGKGAATLEPGAFEQINSLLGANEQTSGPLRALWVGDQWTSPIPTTGRPVRDFVLTDARGAELTDLFASDSGQGSALLHEVLGSIAAGETDRAGKLLGSFNIRYVIVARDSDTRPWLSQRDLALVRTEQDVLVFEDSSALDRAALYDELPRYVAAVDEEDARLASGSEQIERAALVRRSPATYRGVELAGPGMVFLAESTHDGWTATANGESLERAESGWGNAFSVPGGAVETLVVDHPRSAFEVATLTALPLLWIFVIGAAFPSRRREKARMRA
jgi:hypothetical protein